jgi:hypothetical protein
MNSVAGQYHLRTEGAAANDAAHKDAFFDALENALGDTSKDSAAADNAAGASAAPAADGRTAGRDGDDAVDTSDGTKITDPGPGDPRPRIESGGREGVVVMDMRPHHNFVKVRWDGEDSEQTIPAPDDPAAEPAAAEGADADEANVLNAAARHGAPQAGVVKGVPDPLETSSSRDLCRESLYKTSLGNCYENCAWSCGVWTPSHSTPAESRLG